MVRAALCRCCHLWSCQSLKAACSTSQGAAFSKLSVLSCIERFEQRRSIMSLAKAHICSKPQHCPQQGNCRVKRKQQRRNVIAKTRIRKALVTRWYSALVSESPQTGQIPHLNMRRSLAKPHKAASRLVASDMRLDDDNTAPHMLVPACLGVSPPMALHYCSCCILVSQPGALQMPPPMLLYPDSRLHMCCRRLLKTTVPN